MSVFYHMEHNNKMGIKTVSQGAQKLKNQIDKNN